MADMEDPDPDEMEWESYLDNRPIRVSLANKIPASFASSTFDGHRPEYLPDSCVKNLITQTTVDDELKQINHSYPWFNDQKRTQLAVWIEQHAKKILAITLLCDLEPSMLIMAMSYFKKFGFTDDCLPIDNPKTWDSNQRPVRRQAFDARIWEGLKISRFYKEQWCCLAPVFSPARYEYDLPLHCILPFIKTGTPPKKGAFSSVHRVEIHEDHQRHPHLRHVSNVPQH
jgi:hypothetical protein